MHYSLLHKDYLLTKRIGRFVIAQVQPQWEREVKAPILTKAVQDTIQTLHIGVKRFARCRKK